MWGIGVDKDQLFLGDHIYTSAVKKVDEEKLYQTIQQVVDGTFAGGVTALGLKEKGVGLGQVNPKVPQDVVDKVNALIPKIISGEIQVSDTPKVKSGRPGERARPLPRRYVTRQMEADPFLELRGITKRYGGLVREPRYRSHGGQRRGAGAAGRERRRQEHADERALRAGPARRGRDPAARAAAADPFAQGRDRRRHRHGAPALHADPGDDGGREHRAGDEPRNGPARSTRRGQPAGGRAVGALRAAVRPDASVERSVVGSSGSRS